MGDGSVGGDEWNTRKGNCMPSYTLAKAFQGDKNPPGFLQEPCNEIPLH